MDLVNAQLKVVTAQLTVVMDWLELLDADANGIGNILVAILLLSIILIGVGFVNIYFMRELVSEFKEGKKMFGRRGGEEE